jgi:hypothetical protein
MNVQIVFLQNASTLSIIYNLMSKNLYADPSVENWQFVDTSGRLWYIFVLVIFQLLWVFGLFKSFGYVSLVGVEIAHTGQYWVINE